MKTAEKVDEVTDMPEDLPYIFLLIPFDPKMNTKTGFENIVNSAAAKNENELLRKYPEEKVRPVILKLHRIIKSLDQNTHKKSIAIIVSPLIEKVYYFNYTSPLQWNNFGMQMMS